MCGIFTHVSKGPARRVVLGANAREYVGKGNGSENTSLLLPFHIARETSPSSQSHRRL